MRRPKSQATQTWSKFHGGPTGDLQRLNRVSENTLLGLTSWAEGLISNPRTSFLIRTNERDQLTAPPSRSMDIPHLPHLHVQYDYWRRRKIAVVLICIIIFSLDAANLSFRQYYNKIPYHTSALSGAAWVLELINGHPDRIYHELGM
jgi:hypothetical protein